ncbi:MAG: hypothetical protein GF344_19545 [Chitinivibrionales bacterium]|nr:hypothetical protein [Chitinivibrionales bacterium]MBD3358820.1 hypothetical protein [Chitinivibrionales bacterium]
MAATRKIDCMHCPHLASCPRTTRLYVNYCGSTAAGVGSRIHEAESDCVARRGFVFRTFTAIQPQLNFRRSIRRGAHAA